MGHRYRIRHSSDYWRIYKPYYKHSDKHGRVLEHRYIYHLYLSIKYNRIIYLPKSYEVHHKNNNGFDNRIENLELLMDKRHSSITSQIRAYPETLNDIIPINKSDYFCNLCKSNKTNKVIRRGKHVYDNWHIDINGFLCHICYSVINQYKRKFGII